MNTKAKVENCRFIFMCSRTWEDLSEISEHPNVRYCEKCDHSVHLCTFADVLEHVENGHCVALIRDDQEETEAPKGRKLIGLIDIHSLKISDEQ